MTPTRSEFRPGAALRRMRRLTDMISAFAAGHRVEHTVSFRECMKHMRLAYRHTGDARRMSLAAARRHFRNMNIAVIEKAGRGKA